MATPLLNPERLTREALATVPLLLEEWGDKPFEDKPSSKGWHELLSSEHAGVHATCAALKLVAHPNLPLSPKRRRDLVKSALPGLMLLFESELKHIKKRPDKATDARLSTVKAASFVSTCATLLERNLLTSKSRAATRAKQIAVQLLRGRRRNGWGHWIGQAPADDQYAATGAAMEALHHFASVNKTIDKQACPILGILSQRIRARLADLVWRRAAAVTVGKATGTTVSELWARLPLLRALATMQVTLGAEWEFEQFLNPFLSREVFGWGLNTTEDFQKYKRTTTGAHAASGTDYVSFNTTACLVQAILIAAQTGKIRRAFLSRTNWHLCNWANQLRNGSLPEPRRFSFLHQAVSCLLAASAIHRQDKPPIATKLEATRFFPYNQPMQITPLVFDVRDYPLNLKQGFFITPFNPDIEVRGVHHTREQIEECIRLACYSFRKNRHGITFFAGDHNYISKGIMRHIWQYINESGFAVALCVKANPNVYYEIGMAHTLGKPVLLLGQAGHKERDFQFDIQGVRYETLRKFDEEEIRKKVWAFLEELFR